MHHSSSQVMPCMATLWLLILYLFDLGCGFEFCIMGIRKEKQVG